MFYLKRAYSLFLAAEQQTQCLVLFSVFQCFSVSVLFWHTHTAVLLISSISRDHMSSGRQGGHHHHHQQQQQHLFSDSNSHRQILCCRRLGTSLSLFYFSQWAAVSLAYLLCFFDDDEPLLLCLASLADYSDCTVVVRLGCQSGWWSLLGNWCASSSSSMCVCVLNFVESIPICHPTQTVSLTTYCRMRLLLFKRSAKKVTHKKVC